MDEQEKAEFKKRFTLKMFYEGTTGYDIVWRSTMQSSKETKLGSEIYSPEDEIAEVIEFIDGLIKKKLRGINK